MLFFSQKPPCNNSFVRGWTSYLLSDEFVQRRADREVEAWVFAVQVHESPSTPIFAALTLMLTGLAVTISLLVSEGDDLNRSVDHLGL